MTASKKILVEYRGRMVTPRSKQIYEALAAGMTQKYCADTFGVAYGSMSGYAKRARAIGLTIRNRDFRTIVVVSTQHGTEGQRYEMRGEKEIQAFGFEYATAWGYARRKVERHGYLWFFKVEL